MGRWRTIVRIIMPAVAMLGLFELPSASASSEQFKNWASYLFDGLHSSYNAQATAITPANANGLVVAWNFRVPDPTMPGQPGGRLTEARCRR